MNNTETTIKQNLQAESPTVEAETQASARLVLPPDTPFQEVSTATLVTVDNTTNTIVDTNQCDSGHTVYVEYEYIRKPDKKAIKSIYLKIKQSGEQQGLICLCNATKIGTGNNAYYVSENIIDNTNAVQELCQDGVYYSVINITDKLPNAQGVFALVASDNAQVEYTGSVTFETQVVPYVDIMEQSAVLQKELSENTQYEVNLLNGRLFATTQLYSATGNLMPAQLSLTYNEAYNNAQSVHGMPLFAKGWKLNYQQCVVFNDDNTCTYVDGNFKERLFKLADNSTDVYYDFDGKSDIRIVRFSNGKSRLVIADYSYMEFDESGKLMVIYDKKGANSVTTEIEYDAEGLPCLIYDGAGRAITFNRVDNTFYVKCIEQDVARFTISLQNNLIGTHCISQPAVNFVYEDNKLVTATDVLSRKEVRFTYDTANSVSKIKNYSWANKKSKKLLYTEFFEYKALETIIYVSNINEQKSNACFETHYMFAENGDFLYKIEGSNDVFSPIIYENKDAYSKEKNRSNAKPLLFDNKNGVSLPISKNATENTTRVVTTDYKNISSGTSEYIVGTQVQIVSPTCQSSDGQVCLRVTANQTYPQTNHVIQVEKAVDVSHNKWQCLSAIIEGLHAEATYTFTVEVISKNFNSVVNVRNTYIAVQNGLMTADVIRVTNGNAPQTILDQTEFKEYTTKTKYTVWYKMHNVNLKIDDSNMDNVIFTYKDYLYTLKSYSKGGSFNVYYNNGSNMYANASSLDFVYYEPSQYYPTATSTLIVHFADIEMSTLQYNNALAFVHVSFDEDGHTQLVSSNVQHDGERCVATSVSKYTPTGLLTSVTNSDGITTEYSYDNWGNLTEEKTISSDQTNYMVSSWQYTYDGNYLRCQTEHLSESEVTRSYEYTAEGLLSKQKDSNNHAQNYTYDTLQRLTSTDSTARAVVNKNQIAYMGGFVSSLSHNETIFAFDYDDLGNVYEVTVGNCFAWNKEMFPQIDGTAWQDLTYGNEQQIRKYYDKYGHLTSVVKKQEDAEQPLVYYIYSDSEIDDSVVLPNVGTRVSASSKLRKVVDLSLNLVYNYTYDELGQLKSVESNALKVEVSNDELNRPYKIEYVDDGVEYSQQVTYKNALSNEVVSEKFTCGEVEVETTYEKDSFGRVIKETAAVSDSIYSYETNYTYSNKAGNPSQATGALSECSTYYNDSTFKTKTLVCSNSISNYDANGNVTQTSVSCYEYDSLNRLIREDNQAFERSYTWTYDAGGNITARREFAYTTDSLGEILSVQNYVYGATWKDQLTSFNGNAITYDKAGNPLVYGDKTFEWQQGRLLSKVQTGNEEVALFYDHNGLRTNKIVYNGLETRTESYKYDGNKLVSMRSMKNALDDTYNRKFVFVYNSNGIIGFILDGDYYYYAKNEFGDVVAIVDQNSNTIARYFYDAWGNVLVKDGNRQPITDTSHIAHLNPIRYRGYFYDVDLGLYYLQSRYYDPQTGRFINADTLDYLDPEKH